MRIVKTVADMQAAVRSLKKDGKKISLVPTMGALHDGHLSLLTLAQRNADVTIMSIFVNPTQFGPSEDFSKYPRPFEADAAKAQGAGCNMLFAPTAEDMYPKGYHTYVAVDEITARLCGASRPGHFRGVTTVVLKFFNIVQPDCAVFGQKDAQQAIVIRRMVDDLNLGVRIVVAPTAREADGLAMSSRNVYLTSDERAAAPAIRRGLQRAEEAYRKGARSSTDLKALVADEITAAALLTPEYVELVDTRTIEPVGTLSATALLAVACRTAQSKTRLIDNVILGGTL